MYQEYPPDIRLQHLIETYWIANGIVDAPLTQGVMPDGCVDIIFDFGDNKTGFPKLVGTMTSLLEISYQPGKVQMMGIRFAPGGITAFTRIPVNEITNRNIELPISETLFDSAFHESLPEINQIQERLAYINRYFIKRLHKLYSLNEQINHAVSLIQSHNGRLTIRQLAKESCLCERHLERKFKLAIGISPKVFSNVMRFQFARHYLKSHEKESLSSAAIVCGYHDLSHMNKEFQVFGSISPSEL